MSPDLLLRAACHLFIKKDLSEVWYLFTRAGSFQHQCVSWMHCTSSVVTHRLHQAHAPCTLFPQLKLVLHALWEKLDITGKPKLCLYLQGSDLGFNFKSVVQYTTVIWKSTIRASLKYKTHWCSRSLILVKYLSASLGSAENPSLSAVPWCKDCSCGHCLIVQSWLKTPCCAEILNEKEWGAFWSWLGLDQKPPAIS